MDNLVRIPIESYDEPVFQRIISDALIVERLASKMIGDRIGSEHPWGMYLSMGYTIGVHHLDGEPRRICDRLFRTLIGDPSVGWRMILPRHVMMPVLLSDEWDRGISGMGFLDSRHKGKACDELVRDHVFERIWPVHPDNARALIHPWSATYYRCLDPEAHARWHDQVRSEYAERQVRAREQRLLGEKRLKRINESCADYVSAHRDIAADIRRGEFVLPDEPCPMPARGMGHYATLSDIEQNPGWQAREREAAAAWIDPDSFRSSLWACDPERFEYDGQSLAV